MSSRTVAYKVKLDEGEMLVNLSFVNGKLLRCAWGSGHHCHASYELHVILKGKCVIDVENVRHELSAGSALLIAAGKYHKPESLSDEMERLSLSFTISEGVLSESLKEAVSESIAFSPSEDFFWYVKKLIEEGTSKNPLKDAATEALVVLLSLSLLRTLGIAKYVEKGTWMRDEVERTEVVDLFFARRFAEKSGCATLAKEMHMSTKQLNRVLKKHYGMGFQEKLIATRMEHASLLLRTTSMRVQDVIEAIGYSSYEAFYKAFISKFGVNPQKYRRAYKKE